MGGGGGSAGTAARGKSAGLMSWGEAWSVWTALRRADALTKETHKIWLSSADRQERDAIATRLRAEWAVLPGRLAQAAFPLLTALLAGLTGGQPARTSAEKPPNRFSESRPPALTVSPLGKLQQGVWSIAEKVALLLGEARLKLDDAIHQGLEGLKRLLLNPVRTFWMTALAQLNNLNNLTESLRQELRSVWRSLERFAQSLTDSLWSWLTGSERDASGGRSDRDNKRKRNKDWESVSSDSEPTDEVSE